LNNQKDLKNRCLVLGIDGGGSKTACALMDLQGTILAHREGIGTSYRQYGMDAVINTICSLRDDCLADASASREQLCAVCAGLPGYGEHSQMDKEMLNRLQTIFPYFLLVNDVYVGWAGSLALKSGINLVSGTGSIAFGMDTAGKSARSGGWCEYFGDEGSSYWLAIRGMQLFTKQSDYRVPRGPLYDIVKKEFSLDDDFEFITHMEKDYIPYRDKVASFHYLVAEAARQGDTAVIRLYDEAATELAQIVRSVREQIGNPKDCKIVSYSGGTFRVGGFLLNPLRRQIEKMDMFLEPPVYSPVIGALLLAVKEMKPNHLKDVLKGLKKAECSFE
jgi:N-acetylglucosamine kinase-like BadF-type ATPase